MSDTAIAVIGIDCRLPGAATPAALWELLMNSSVTAAEVPATRWEADDFYHPHPRAGQINTRYASFIEDPDAFDNEFFGISPTEAAALDPQQRLVLQSAWRALEDAAVDPRSLAGTETGVYVGMMSSEWGALNLLDYPRITPHRGIGGGHAMVANRVSYHLNLTGPSVTVDTACSASLTAVHLACQALQCGETDLVLVSGVNLLLTPGLSIFYAQSGLSAPDGRCKPFNAGADGIGRGEGVGTVVLRRLSDAVADGQPVYAVIAGSAANQDGRSNGISAPNRWAQVAVMERALGRAGIAARDVDFVEAHGTGTVLGDMIESNALGDLHKSGRDLPCLLGSIKGNIGHAEGAAGIAALIKTSLALAHRVVPPTVCTGGPNPALRLEQNGLQLAIDPVALPGRRLVAGISSFGLGGSNAHVVLTSAPVPHAPPAPTGAHMGVLTVSASSDAGLRTNAATLASALQSCDTTEFAALCYTSNRVKSSLKHRFAAGGTRDDIVSALHEYALNTSPETPGSATPGVGLLCTGQGAQYPGMTRELFESCPPYRTQLTRAARAVDRTLGHSGGLLELMFGGHASGPPLQQTRYAQPSLFAVSYALGAALLDLGLQPAFVIGHSVGEFAAAALAGVLTLDDAATLVVARGRLMQQLPAGGAMCAVDVAAADVAATLQSSGASGCAVAAVNGPRATVLSGAAEAVDRVVATLVAGGARATPLAVSHAFHSPLMAPAQPQFGLIAATVRPQPGAIPVVSTVSGRTIDGAAMDAGYWTGQFTSPVLFADAVAAAVRAYAPTHLIELGPRATLVTLARRCGVAAAVRTLAPCRGPDADGSGLARVVASLYTDGLPLSFDNLYADATRILKRLPPYTFSDGARFWRDTAVPKPVQTAPRGEPGTTPAPRTDVRERVPGSCSEHDAVAAAVRAMVAEIGGYPGGDINPEALMGEDLGFDSLMQLRLIDRLRSAYPQLENTAIGDILPLIRTVNDLAQLVSERVTPQQLAR